MGICFYSQTVKFAVFSVCVQIFHIIALWNVQNNTTGSHTADGIIGIVINQTADFSRCNDGLIIFPQGLQLSVGIHRLTNNVVREGSLSGFIVTQLAHQQKFVAVAVIVCGI